MRPSHTYKFIRRDLLTAAGLPLLGVTVFALVLQLGVRLNLLPTPRPALDTDRTILIHQAEATRTAHKADLLLLGDSSCLMDVSAEQLATALPARDVLNLGTLSYLDLKAFATMLRQYLHSNPGRLRTVVLLMHPEALRRPSPADYDVQALQAFYSNRDFCGPALPPLLCWLGVESFRGRLLSRAVPVPLPGAYGRQYGFNRDLWNYLSAHRGSAIDPGRFDPANVHGNAEYRLSKSLEFASRAFRASVPKEMELVAGITPVPESFVAFAKYQILYERMLHDWNEWLGADALLTNLPPTLPDELFASKTHLNASGIVQYTAQLGRELERLPVAPPSR